MTLFGALRSGVSGLYTQGQALGTISDNIANVNTVGYKTKRIRFSTVVSQNGNAEVFSPGGVTQVTRNEIGSQGLIQGGQAPTDLAIQGNGFFAVTNSLTLNRTTGKYEISGGIFFTRAGEFRTDGDGNLRNAQGNYLVGYPPDPNLAGQFQQTNIVSDFVGINAGAQTSPPIPTSNIRVSGNLNTNVAPGSSAKVTVPLYDKLGVQRNVEITYTRTAEITNTWNATARILPETVNTQPTNDKLKPNLRIGGLRFATGDGKGTDLTATGDTLQSPKSFEITLAFDEKLNQTALPVASHFSIGHFGADTNNVPNYGIAANAPQISSVSIDGRTVTIKGTVRSLNGYRALTGQNFVNTAAATVTGNPNNVNIIYTPPAGSAPILQDVNGNAVSPRGTAINLDTTLNSHRTNKIRAAAGAFDLGKLTFENGIIKNFEKAEDGLEQPDGTINMGATISYFNGSNDTENVKLLFDFGTSGQTDGLTQFGTSSSGSANPSDNFTINSLTQNGRTFGTLTSVQVSENGVLNAAFDNGENRSLSQIPVVTFNSPNTLEELTGNIFRPTATSGSPIPHVAGSGGAGLVQSNAVEASTVDIAFEFTELITTQRAYAANTRIITTADNLLQELLQTVR